MHDGTVISLTALELEGVNAGMWFRLMRCEGRLPVERKARARE